MLLLLPIWALSGCRDGGVRSISDQLTVAPDEVIFPEAWTGYPTWSELRLTTSGKADVEVQVTVEGAAFSAASEVIRVTPGETARVELQFAPQSHGIFQGSVRLSANDWSAQVPLYARSRQTPSCVPSSSCSESAFDPVIGMCSEHLVPDGTSCTGTCLGAGHCEMGVCKGEAAPCDDGDLCTEDACDSASGCVHTAVTCAEVSDPCQASACDPQQGCISVPVMDGTLCGPADCTSSHVCLSGVCAERPTPEGGACKVSPCADPGVCRTGVCQQPSSTTLPAAWTYSPPPNATLLFPGVADDAGNLFWLECVEGRCALTSVMVDGTLRGRWPLQHPMGAFSEDAGTLVRAGDVLVLTQAANWIEARTLSGGLAWDRNLLADLAPEFVSPTSSAKVLPRRAVYDGQELLIVRVMHDAPTDSDGEGCWLLGIGSVTGALKWKHHFEQRCTDALVGAGKEGVIVGTAHQTMNGPVTPVLHRVALDGELVWSEPQQKLALPVAVQGSTVLLDDATAVGLANGKIVGSVGTVGGFASAPDPVSPLLSGKLGYWLGPTPSGVGTQVTQMDPVSFAPRWDLVIPMQPPFLTQPVLTQRKSLLVGGGRPMAPMPQLLREIAQNGSVLFECPLASGPLSGAPVMTRGYWIAAEGSPESRRIRAFDMAGLLPAQSGWTTLAGSSTRTGNALP